MKYQVKKSVIDILGGIWMPYGALAALRKELSAYDVENIKARGDGEITRDSVEQWLMLNSGDFSEVKDFAYSIEDGEKSFDAPFSNEENEIAYSDCMYPCEE